jgi:acyl-CoA thioester hydrolase
LRRRVEWRDIDTAQHVNNAIYLAYMEDCGEQAAVAHGWPRARMRAEGFSIAIQRHRIEYRLPALFGDELELATWLSDVEHNTAVRHYTITRVSDGALLARARTVWGTVDAKTGRPVPILARLLHDFAPHVAG